MEIIVVDGGSTDKTAEIAEGFSSVKVLLSPKRGRAAQMNFGAEISSGEVLLFLHGDTILPPGWEKAITECLLKKTVQGGCFSVTLSNERIIYRLSCMVWNSKTRFLRIFTGDQGIFVRKVFFERVGGFPDVPLMEDVLFSDSMRKAGTRATRKKVEISARYWEKWGPYRTILLMWYTKYLFRRGMSPEELAPYYREGKFSPFNKHTKSGQNSSGSR